MSHTGHTANTPSHGSFTATHWSLVLAAARDASCGGASARALAELCRIYWYPLYAYIRRRGYPRHDAEDLTQAFFARLLERHDLAGIDRDKGKFRSFLLAALQHFLANEWDKTQARKRGGGLQTLPLDAMEAEARYAVEPAADETPERLFERRWAWAVLDQVLLCLRNEYTQRGDADLFEALKGLLTAAADNQPYAQIAAARGTTPGAIKVAAHRLRRRYRELLRDQIAQTVATPELIDEEIGHLRNAL